MINVPFNGLPRAVRERLVKLTTDKQDDPQRLLSAPGSATGWVAWFFAFGALVAVGLCGQFIIERHAHGTRPHSDIEVYLGAGVALFVFFLAASRIIMRRVWPKPPYRTGKWVLSSGLLELSDGALQFLPLGELPRPTLVTVRRNGRYQHTRLDLTPQYWFYFPKPQLAEDAVNRVLQAKARYVALLAARDEAGVRAVDPLAECTLSGVWTVTENSVFGVEGPLATPVPWRAVGLQVLISALLAFALPAVLYALWSPHLT